VVADEHIGPTSFEIFSSMELVPDECEYAEDPAPQPEEKITDAAGAKPEEERQNEAGQKQQHEDRKNQEHPDPIKCGKYFFHAVLGLF
jgi:hypothetical protein